MAMNLKDPETEQLVAEVADATGLSKTAVVRESVREYRGKLAAHDSVEEREAHLQRFMEEEIWPLIPPELLGTPISKEEKEEILGFGPEGA